MAYGNYGLRFTSLWIFVYMILSDADTWRIKINDLSLIVHGRLETNMKK